MVFLPVGELRLFLFPPFSTHEHETGYTNH